VRGLHISVTACKCTIPSHCRRVHTPLSSVNSVQIGFKQSENMHTRMRTTPLRSQPHTPLRPTIADRQVQQKHQDRLPLGAKQPRTKPRHALTALHTNPPRLPNFAACHPPLLRPRSPLVSHPTAPKFHIKHRDSGVARRREQRKEQPQSNPVRRFVGMLNFIGVSEIALFRENFLRFVNNVKIVGPPVSREEWLPLARKTIVGLWEIKLYSNMGFRGFLGSGSYPELFSQCHSDTPGGHAR